MASSHVWYYLDASGFIAREKGPFTESQLIALVRDGTIKKSTRIRSPTRTDNREITVEAFPKLAALIVETSDAAEHSDASNHVMRSNVLSWLLNKLKNRKLKSLQAKFHQQFANRKAMLGNLREDPLLGFEVCSQCCWIGPGIERKQIAGRLEVVGATSALSGAVLGLGGAAAATGGGLMMISGILLLPCCGIGIIPLLAGIGLLGTGTVAGTGGAVMGSMGNISSAQALERRRQQEMQPTACPVCRALAIVPISYPRGRQLIDTNPHLRQQATLEYDRILQWVSQQEAELIKLEPPVDVDMTIETNAVLMVLASLVGTLIGVTVGILCSM